MAKCLGLWESTIAQQFFPIARDEELNGASGLDVVIVGGGIGGLFAANALGAEGLRVTVYEQAPAIGEVGAGVFLTPNSVRHLQRIGLEPSVEKWGARVGHGFSLFPP